MALTKSYTTPQNIVLPNAYAVIKHVLLDKMEKNAEVRVAIYKDEDARNSNEFSPIQTKFIRLNGRLDDNDAITYDTYFALELLNQTNTDVYKQAYEYIKSVDFNGWENI